MYWAIMAESEGSEFRSLMADMQRRNGDRQQFLNAAAWACFVDLRLSGRLPWLE